MELLSIHVLSSPDLPGEPSKLRVVDSTKTSITLGWEKPVYDGGSEITHYILDQMNSEDKEWVTINPQVKTCEYVVSHLKPGIYYYFRVSAVNCKGKGEEIKMYQPVQAKDILGLYSSRLFYGIMQGKNLYCKIYVMINIFFNKICFMPNRNKLISNHLSVRLFLWLEIIALDCYTD